MSKGLETVRGVQGSKNTRSWATLNIAGTGLELLAYELQ